MRSLPFLLVAGASSSIALAACETEPEEQHACVSVDHACAPAYEPTFDNLFVKTFKPSCALEGTSCHAAAGAKAGLIFENADTAYDLLHQRRRAIAGDPECSVVTSRIQSKDTSFQMPPGMALPAAEQCAITQWIARGALR